MAWPLKALEGHRMTVRVLLTRNTYAESRGLFLLQARASERFQVVRPLSRLFDQHLALDPGQGDVGLGPAQFLEGRTGKLSAARHGRGCSQDAVAADEFRALADALAGQAHRLLIVVADELGIGGDAAEDRRERVARA